MCEVLKTLPDRNNKVRNVEVVRRRVSNIMVLVPTEDRPELSLGNCGESAVLDSFAIDENAVQDRLEKYQDESISMSR